MCFYRIFSCLLFVHEYELYLQSICHIHPANNEAEAVNRTFKLIIKFWEQKLFFSVSAADVYFLGCCFFCLVLRMFDIFNQCIDCCCNFIITSTEKTVGKNHRKYREIRAFLRQLHWYCSLVWMRWYNSVFPTKSSLIVLLLFFFTFWVKIVLVHNVVSVHKWRAAIAY